jgi:hypothetical protein
MRTVGEIWSLAAEAAEAAAGAGGAEAGWVSALGVLGELDRLSLLQVAAALAALVGRTPLGLTPALRAGADEALAVELWALPPAPSAGLGDA